MDFITAQKEVSAQLGLDYTQTDTATLLKRWLNLAYQDVVGWKSWSWLQGTDTVVTATDYTTGTVSATAASATITFSSGPTASQSNRYIQFSSADDWYKITAHTAGETTATISPAYAQTSNLSAGTFTIRTFYYSLSSTTERVLNCRQANTPRYIPVHNVNLVDKIDPFPDSTGDVEAIYLWGMDSNNYWTFTPYPWPDSVQLLEFRVYKKATELSATTDTPIFPERFTSVWLDRAKAYGWENEDDTRSNDAFTRTEKALNRLKSLDRVGTLEKTTIEAIDSGRERSHFIRFPSDYGDAV